MANTFELISSSTVGSGGSSSIDFTSIPSTYTDLCLKLSARSNLASEYEFVNLRFNSSTSGYTNRVIRGNGTSATSQVNGNTGFEFEMAQGNSTTANTFCNMEIYVPNYLSSVAKCVSADGVGENNATLIYMGLNAGRWTGTEAISSIQILPLVGTSWQQHSTAYLYGIKNS